MALVQLGPQHPRSRGEDRRSIVGPDPVGQILNFPNSESRLPRHSPVDDSSAPFSADSLDEVDQIFELRSLRLTQSTERTSQVGVDRAELHEYFLSICTHIVRPTMQAFLERLRMNGGGGLLEMREGVQNAGVAARIRLWMSLSGDLIGRPRRNQHPYLELDLDVAHLQVNVAEGDMWKGHGTSGPVGVWNASEITSTLITESLLGILRRAAG